MALFFNHATKRIVVSEPQNRIDMQDLIDAVRDEESSRVGIADDVIATAAGKDILDTGVAVGITVTLLETWKIQWWPGNYTAKLAGGNLIARSGDPVAYVQNGPQVEIILSAAATIVSGSGGIGGMTDEDRQTLTEAHDYAAIAARNTQY
jgi:hypothetical protein